jgi:hypothetical protein
MRRKKAIKEESDWQRTEKIKWIERINNGEVLRRSREKRNMMSSPIRRVKRTGNSFSHQNNQAH